MDRNINVELLKVNEIIVVIVVNAKPAFLYGFGYSFPHLDYSHGVEC